MKPRKQAPTTTEFLALRAHLTRLGFALAEIEAAVGTAGGGRTREQVTAGLREWLRTRPRGDN